MEIMAIFESTNGLGVILNELHACGRCGTLTIFYRMIAGRGYCYRCATLTEEVGCDERASNRIG